VDYAVRSKFKAEAEVVSKDERVNSGSCGGILNFGHTFGPRWESRRLIRDINDGEGSGGLGEWMAAGVVWAEIRGTPQRMLRGLFRL